jgi:hypothetical protein
MHGEKYRLAAIADLERKLYEEFGVESSLRSAYPQVLRPSAAHVVPCDTRHASASDERPPASHLADTGPLAAGVRARLAGRREADSTDQLRQAHARVEVRVLWYRLTAPLPAGVSHVVGFLLGFAPKRPSRALANVVMSMQGFCQN